MWFGIETDPMSHLALPRTSGIAQHLHLLIHAAPHLFVHRSLADEVEVQHLISFLSQPMDPVFGLELEQTTNLN